MDKTFVEDTAILDKLKAAAVVTDGEYRFPTKHTFMRTDNWLTLISITLMSCSV